MVKLTLTMKDFEEIHKALDKVRSNAKFVKVDRQALTDLLIDHTNLLQETKHENESK